MLKVILLGALALGGLCYNLIQYTQNDYILISERWELIENNEDYMADIVVKNFKYNRTNSAVNISGIWKVDVPGPLMFLAQGYKFSSNEYPLFPFILPFNFCDILKRNVFGLQIMYDCGNFFHCPIKKGPFKTCNWNPDYTKFPPHAPVGRYMFGITWKVSGIQVVKYNWYVEIKEIPLPY